MYSEGKLHRQPNTALSVAGLVGHVDDLPRATAESAGSSGGDQTDLSARGRVAGDARGGADVLVITTAERVLDRVHAHALDARPPAAFRLGFVVGGASLQHGLVGTTATGDDAEHGTARAGDGLLGAGRQLDLGDALVGVVRDDGGVVAGAPGERASVAELALEVAHDGTLGEVADGQDVADGERSLLAAVDELAGEHALGGDEELGSLAVAVSLREDDSGERSATSGVVDDLLSRNRT